MSGTSVHDFFSRQAQEARGPEPEGPAKARPPRRKRRARRIAIGAALAVVVLIGGVAGTAFLAVNHLVGSVQRINGIAALTAADQPVMPVATRKSITVLLTSAPTRPSQVGGHGLAGASTKPEALSGLVALVHLNANDRGGAVVSIPANSVVDVPGHGRLQLWSTLAIGGPSLLIRTVEHLTNVRISHYSVLDFAGAVNVIRAMNGVNVDVPHPFSSQGFSFPAGVNRLTAADVLPYVRQNDVSEVVRTELQQNLIRAMLSKIANRHLFSHLGTDYTLLHAMTGALSVDSNFSNSQLESFALRLGSLPASSGTFITAPTSAATGTGPVYLHVPLTSRLWRALRHDTVGAFARRYPFTVTPGAPG